jgi:hypothetical protein
MKIIAMDKNKKLTIPKEITEKFSSDDRFLVTATEDTVILKKINTPRMHEIAKGDEQEPPMEEIVLAVHKSRKKRTS